MLAITENLYAVDKDVYHPGGILVWVVESGVILNLGRVKDHHVGQVTLPEHATALNAEIFRRKGTQFANRLL